MFDDTIKCVELLKIGADPNIPDIYSATPLLHGIFDELKFIQTNYEK